jgi:hypothetical protein
MTGEAETLGRDGELTMDRAEPTRDDVRERAIETLMAVFRRVQRDVAESGWLMLGQPRVRRADHDTVRFAMLRDGMIVSECGFSIGADSAVAFGRPAHRTVTGVLDTMGESEFHALIAVWASEVQAGIGHRWHYEAMQRGRGG